jgi:hypothetical protein
MDTDAEDVADRLFAALNEKRWGDAVDLISPAGMASFDEGVRELAKHSSPAEVASLYSALLGVGDPKAVQDLSARDLLIAHARHSDPDTKIPHYMGSARLVRTPLGVVREGSRQAHVVYRAAFYRGSRVFGDEALAVLTLNLTPDGWRAHRVDFSADLVFMGPSWTTGVADLKEAQ